MKQVWWARLFQHNEEHSPGPRTPTMLGAPVSTHTCVLWHSRRQLRRNFPLLYLFPDFVPLALYYYMASWSLLNNLHQNNTLLMKAPQWCSTAKSSTHIIKETDRRRGLLQPQETSSSAMSKRLCGPQFFHVQYLECSTWFTPLFD